MPRPKTTTHGLPEPEAWELVARRWVERSLPQRVTLAMALGDLYLLQRISSTTYMTMRQRLFDYLGDGDTLSYQPSRDELLTPRGRVLYLAKHREALVLSALWLGEEARSEGSG